MKKRGSGIFPAIIIIFCLFAGILSLTSCGKKGDPLPPEEPVLTR
jgi:predicted small lipoprotein YifL